MSSLNWKLSCVTAIRLLLFYNNIHPVLILMILTDFRKKNVHGRTVSKIWNIHDSDVTAAEVQLDISWRPGGTRSLSNNHHRFPRRMQTSCTTQSIEHQQIPLARSCNTAFNRIIGRMLSGHQKDIHTGISSCWSVMSCCARWPVEHRNSNSLEASLS